MLLLSLWLSLNFAKPAIVWFAYGINAEDVYNKALISLSSYKKTMRTAYLFRFVLFTTLSLGSDAPFTEVIHLPQNTTLKNKWSVRPAALAASTSLDWVLVVDSDTFACSDVGHVFLEASSLEIEFAQNYHDTTLSGTPDNGVLLIKLNHWTRKCLMQFVDDLEVDADIHDQYALYKVKQRCHMHEGRLTPIMSARFLSVSNSWAFDENRKIDQTFVLDGPVKIFHDNHIVSRNATEQFCALINASLLRRTLVLQYDLADRWPQNVTKYTAQIATMTLEECRTSSPCNIAYFNIDNAHKLIDVI